MANDLIKPEEWVKEISISLKPEYEQLSKELIPLLTRLLKSVDNGRSESLQLKKNAKEFFNRFNRAIKISGKVSSLQKLTLTTKEPQIVATLKLFQYLGQVESIGTIIVDMLVLLVITDGQHFHVEQSYALPRIVHARNFEDLDQSHSTLAEKLSFLERSGLKITSKIFDRKIRNDIAHLNFDIDKQGNISTKHFRNLDVDEKLNHFTKCFIGFLMILTNTGFLNFLNRSIKKKELTEKNSADSS